MYWLNFIWIVSVKRMFKGVLKTVILRGLISVLEVGLELKNHKF